MTRCERRWLGCLAAASAFAAGNRSALQLDVVLRDGPSVRALGAVSGHATASFEVPTGIPSRNIGARLTPGVATSRAGSRSVVRQFHQRGEGAARLVSGVHRG